MPNQHMVLLVDTQKMHMFIKLMYLLTLCSPCRLVVKSRLSHWIDFEINAFDDFDQLTSETLDTFLHSGECLQAFSRKYLKLRSLKKLESFQVLISTLEYCLPAKVHQVEYPTP